MNSRAQRSEIALGRLGCRPWQNHPAPRVMVGGLGMGFTLRAVLDSLPATAKVVVVELNQGIVDWCRGPLAGLTDNALSDHRVTIEIGDVADLIRRYTRPNEMRFNAIILDLYRGPHTYTDEREDPYTAVGPSKGCTRPSDPAGPWPFGVKTTTRDFSGG